MGQYNLLRRVPSLLHSIDSTLYGTLTGVPFHVTVPNSTDRQSVDDTRRLHANVALFTDGLGVVGINLLGFVVDCVMENDITHNMTHKPHQFCQMNVNIETLNQANRYRTGDTMLCRTIRRVTGGGIVVYIQFVLYSIRRHECRGQIHCLTLVYLLCEFIPIFN
jgi:hypothetical protein